MGRVSYPAIGETSDHPDVDRQSKPHNFRFSLLLFVKVRREQVWLTFYIPWKNQFVNRNIARPFLSSRENVFFLDLHWRKRPTNVPIDNSSHSTVHSTGRLLIPQPTQPPHPSHNATAFYAYLSSDVAHPGQGQILKFDAVKTNAGNGYHPNSGTFIAPETGYYVFSWTSRIKHYGSTGEDHALELIINGQIFGSIYMKSLTGEDGQATGLATAHVNKGDDVYIQTHHQDPGSGAIRSDFYGRSSFTGWKLYWKP